MVFIREREERREMRSRNFNVFVVFLPKSHVETSLASRIGMLVILINNLAENWKNQTKHKKAYA